MLSNVDGVIEFNMSEIIIGMTILMKPLVNWQILPSKQSCQTQYQYRLKLNVYLPTLNLWLTH